MEEKMKKMLFLMLFLLILGAANVTSQVRIGGNGQPNGAAVLDLNATDAINNGTKTLALPRVSLTSTTDQLGYSTLLNGMLVYNTNTTSGAGGVYYWDTNKWVKVSDGAFTEVDGVVGNEVTNATPGLGLVRAGDGTDGSPYTLGIDKDDASVTFRVFDDNSAKFTHFLISGYVRVLPTEIPQNAPATIFVRDSAWYDTRFHKCFVVHSTTALNYGYIGTVDGTGGVLNVAHLPGWPIPADAVGIELICLRVQ